ncbi:NADP-dependent oxidoreductase [Stenotrophomonas maltophilia]|nr:NADP-dependent oxidoreductase [Stenotrophomonas maltophilia]MBA0315876.1 NADP-dependent oxidoreductase [Stenotrophomonas maltophilia]OWQ54627.1 NADP-dependent oxidoreductase [Stenotrophomonas maltophilia]
MERCFHGRRRQSLRRSVGIPFLMLATAEPVTMSDSLATSRIVLASRPQGAPSAANFRLEQAALPALGDGEVLLRNRYLSLDPYMRGRMDEGPSYAAPVAVGAVMEGQTVAEVLRSNAEGVAVGDLLLAPGGWQTHAVLPAKALGRRLDPAGLPLSTALGVYGMPGFTAYSSLHEIARLKPGETLVVAAATGPVGATVAQLAKLQGARVVAIAGGEAKRAYLQTLGVDVALDHRAADFADQLRAAVPAGIDVYFENVGGHVLDAVLPLLNDFARIPVCGTIATYNERGIEQPGPDRLPALFSQILRQRLTVRGFIVHDFNHLWSDFDREMRQWLREGRIQYREDVVEGLENAPEAFFGLLQGRNFGKLVVKLD